MSKNTEEIIVVGHKSPDTDSVVSALVFANFLKQEGKEARSVVAGDANKETELVFSFLKEKLPETVKEDEIKKGEFFLVDHNDLSQSIAKKDKICGVLDHHLLSGVKTDETIFFRIEPVGSTSTLVYKMMKERGMEISEKEAGFLLAGIISDTLNLNSPTTSCEDVDFYYELQEIAKINGSEFAEKMFEAKSDFSGKSLKEIVLGDFKEYEFGGKKVAIGVCEATSLGYFEKKKKAIKDALKEIKKEKQIDALFFGAINIISQNAYFFPAEENEEKVAKEVFKGEDKGDFFLLENIASRKKQIAPPLSKYYGG